jgi:hypothetical protein
MDASLVLPVVLWDAPPSHVITSMVLTLDKQYLITGSRSGMIGIWAVADKDAPAVRPPLLHYFLLINFHVYLMFQFLQANMMRCHRAVHTGGSTDEAAHDAGWLRRRHYRFGPDLSSAHGRLRQLYVGHMVCSCVTRFSRQ